MQLQQNYKAFQDAGVEVVALAISSVSNIDLVRQTTQAAYPMLSDAEHQAAEAYGVFNLLKDGFAAPSVFIIDTDGAVVWRHIGGHANDRPGVQTILNNLP